MSSISLFSEDHPHAATFKTVLSFLGALFEQDDNITIRPVETWTEGDRKKPRVLYKRIVNSRPKGLNLCRSTLVELFDLLQAEKANAFVSVCPRRCNHLAGEENEFAWQIPIVRCLWADLDDCTVEEALKRIVDAGLPEPSVVVSSGNGVHVYWILEKAIETGADSRSAFKEWVEVRGKKVPVPYIWEDREKVYLKCPQTGKPLHSNQPKLTDTALNVQDILQGIAAAIGGDHTYDLCRLLRLPGTLNRKNERNGDEPKPCTLVKCEPDQKYPFESFAKFAQKSPDKQKREKIAKVPLPTVKKLTPGRQDKLAAKILTCDASPVGARSEADFSLCCFAVENGIDRQEVWDRCSSVGKFVEGGEQYFETTWQNASEHTREKLFLKAEQSAQGSTVAPLNTNGRGEDCASEDDRTRIEITTDELAVNDAVIESLAKTDGLYDFNSQLSEVREIDDKEFGKRAVATPLLNPTIRETIAGNVYFYIEVETEEGVKRVKKPTPRWCVEAVAVRGRWPGIPLLRRVVNCPVLRADGTVLQSDGYDQESGLYLDSRIEFEQVPESPTFYQVTSAVDDLMDIICNFPFVADMHRAAWLAALLTPFARETYTGPTAPMFAFDAPKAGSGKTLLVDLISMIVCGHPAWKQSAPRDDEEFRKAITSKALNANPIELIDNISGRFGCSSLDAALTSPVWTDRILGQSRTVELPLKMAWFGTGNNIQFVADLPRRICHIRLEPTVERPDQVGGFKYTNVDQYVKQNRARFVAACLTILRGWFADGKKDKNLPPWGSFEGWSSVVRNAVVWAGLPDPGLTRQAVHDADEDTHALREMIRALLLIDPNRKGKSASEIVRIAQYGEYEVPQEHSEVLRIAIEEFTQTSVNNVGGRLAYRFRAVRRRIVGAHHIDRKTVNGQRLWVVNGTEFIDDDENEDLGAHGPAQGADGCTSKITMCTPETELFP